MRFLKRISLVFGELALGLFVIILLASPATVRLWIEQVESLNFIIRLGLAIVINVAMFFVILMQLRRPRNAQKDDLVVKISGAIADVSVDSVRERVTKAVHAIADVSSVDTKIRAKDGKADIDLQVVMTGSDINVPKKQKQINAVVKKLIKEQLGLQLAGKPRVHIRLESESNRVESEARGIQRTDGISHNIVPDTQPQNMRLVEQTSDTANQQPELVEEAQQLETTTT